MSFVHITYIHSWVPRMNFRPLQSWDRTELYLNINTKSTFLKIYLSFSKIFDLKNWRFAFVVLIRFEHSAPDGTKTVAVSDWLHAVPFIRNVVKICPVLILIFCIVVSYFRGHILASCFLIFMPELWKKNQIFGKQ